MSANSKNMVSRRRNPHVRDGAKSTNIKRIKNVTLSVAVSTVSHVKKPKRISNFYVKRQKSQAKKQKIRRVVNVKFVREGNKKIST